MNPPSNPGNAIPLPAADEGIETLRARMEIGIPRRGSHAGIAVFYALVLLLNGGALQRTVERMPFGSPREFWLVIVRPVAALSRVTRLDAPRAWIERVVHAPPEPPA